MMMNQQQLISTVFIEIQLAERVPRNLLNRKLRYFYGIIPYLVLNTTFHFALLILPSLIRSFLPQVLVAFLFFACLSDLSSYCVVVLTSRCYAVLVYLIWVDI